MGIVVQSNILALNSSNNVKKNQIKTGKNIEKLSSGYKINRAADDAAGLSISEKMRSLIRGLDRASSNCEDGISLVQTAEGALNEVHDMLQRMNELAVASANGTNSLAERTALQQEFSQLQTEIDKISQTATFNGMRVFADGVSREDTSDTTTTAVQNNSSEVTLASLLKEDGDKLKNIIYTETVFDFDTTQTGTGTTNNFTGDYATIANTLQSSIVPQVVNCITDTYTAFNYLIGSSIGIGLNLYSDSSSSTLAYVKMGTSYSYDSNGNYTGKSLTYNLSVNVASVDLSTEAGRSALEQTIAHEMIHAFMDEATTVGMTGISQSGKSDDYKFPMWFIEGMAQTASGPGNWTRASGGLNITNNSTLDEIEAALSGANALSTSESNTTAQYGTGYLASMYLGYLAAGADANMSNSTAAASDIASGVSTILSRLINGESLNAVIQDITGYADVSAFENAFASDAKDFVQQLLAYTSTADANGNVGGGLVSGDLSDADPVENADVSGLKLFALDTGNTQVENVYPSDVTILSGGGTTISGTPPTTSVTPTPPDTPSVVYPSDVFNVIGGTEGVDWEFDTSTGTLKILTDTALTISGGVDPTGTYYGNIEVADGVNVDITLDNVTIDAAKKSGNVAGIDIGNNSTANITMTGTNTITGSGSCAGIQLSDNDDSDGRATLNLKMTTGSSLDITGGTANSLYGGAAIGAGSLSDAAASDINITGSGTIHANGGVSSAAIGAAGDSKGDIGNITIDGGSDGLVIVAQGNDHGAGVGSGWYTTAGDITIKGNIDLDASSKSHGTGIGGGCHGNAGTITIGDPNANNSKIIINAEGGDDGAGIGAGWDGIVTGIYIHGVQS